MPVLINFKICDNAKECNGIAACPAGALFWDDKKKTIVIDNGKCITCGKCEPACMVGAIMVAESNEDYELMKKDIENDKRKASDLFIDRYGAQPIHPAFLIDETKFNTEVLESSKLTVAELFNDESIMCLLHSVPIKELFPKADVKYRKIRVSPGREEFLKPYGIKKLPAMLFFRDGAMVGKIEGFYGVKKKKELIAKIKETI